MIVNYTKEGWQIVTQRSHGILAAQLGFHWKVSERPERWVETILAIAEHDDAEVELGGQNLLTGNGGPLNFDMTVFELAKIEKLSLLTRSRNRYIALLTSLHMEFLYREDAANDPQAEEFLKEQTSLRKEWMKELNITEKEALRIYDLMEWCDACSLLLCQDLVQPENRELEISTGPDKKKYFLIQTGDQTITISPWPFEENRFKINFEWRLIRKLQFASSDEFRQEFLKAKVEETCWEVKKESIPKKKTKV